MQEKEPTPSPGPGPGPSLVDTPPSLDPPLSLVDTLDFLGLPSARGRKRAKVEMQVLRELTVADLGVLLDPPKAGVETRPLARLRHTHHFLARLLAEGKRPGECSLITGYAPSRISILQNDPAFQELLEYYKTQTQEVYLDVHQRLATLGISTIEELQERLEANPDGFTAGQLMALAELVLDRSVAPPKGAKVGGGGNSPTNITIEFVTPQGATIQGQVVSPAEGGGGGEIAHSWR